MTLFVISYDLSKPIADYENLTEETEKFSGWCHLHKSVWLVTTAATSEQVYDKLSRHLDRDDKLFVCQLAHNTAVWTDFDKDITNWIVSHC